MTMTELAARDREYFLTVKRHAIADAMRGIDARRGVADVTRLEQNLARLRAELATMEG